MNGQACCVFGVCCPPESPEQLEQFTDVFLKMHKKTHPKMPRECAQRLAAAYLKKHDYFRDLAPLVESDEEAKSFKEAA